VFKAWNIIDSLLADYTFGHHLWEPKLLTEELRHRRIETRLLGHTSIRGEDFPDARVIPVFPMHHEASLSSDREWGYLENFVVHNLSYEKALRGVDRAVFGNALTLFLNVSERHLLGAVRWLARFDESARPKVAMILKGQFNWSAKNPGLEMYRKIWAGCLPSVKHDIKLCSRSEMNAQKYEQILGMRPHVLPSALGPTEREIKNSQERIGSRTGPMVVSFLAGARHERGAALVPDVVKQCAPLGVRFLIQVTDPIGIETEIASLKSLRDRPEVQFHDGMLSRGDYNDWIAQSVVLLPYSAARYQSRSSGVYLEAKCFGAPVIVPAGTWMAEDVSRLGNGLVFQEYSAASIADCVARAQAELTTLRERAAACAADYRRHQGADRCVDAIENLFDQR